MHSACVCTDQKPSPSGVCAVGSCHSTGRVAPQPGEHVVREPVREQVEIGEIDVRAGISRHDGRTLP